MFGGGAGHVLDMIIRIRNNRAMLKNKSIYKDPKAKMRFSRKYRGWSKKQTKGISVSEEQLLEIRQKFIAAQRRKTRSKLLAFGLAGILALGLTFTLYFSNLGPNKSYEHSLILQDSVKRIELIAFYLKDGDDWLKQNKWNAAITQYQKALDLNPENQTALYRQALAYSYQCEIEAKACDKALLLIDKLISLNPLETEYIHLKAMYFTIINDSALAEQEFARIDELLNSI